MAMVLIFIYSSYRLYSYNKERITSKKTAQNVVSENPSQQAAPINVDFAKLKQENKDIIAWLYCEGTSVNYPVVQAEDNSYYLNHNVKKEYTSHGSIFMDYRNNTNDLEGNNNNVVLYGHRMKNKQMFGSLDKFSDKEYFNGKYPIAIILNDKEYYFEAFSSYVTSSDDNYINTSFDNKEEFDKFIQKIYNKSHTKLDTDITSINNILTLSTCSYEFKDARLVVHAKLIK